MGGQAQAQAKARSVCYPELGPVTHAQRHHADACAVINHDHDSVGIHVNCTIVDAEYVGSDRQRLV